MTESIQQTGRVDSTGHRQEDLPLQNVSHARPIEDDRYPGSFFRVPGVPKPGKTTWSLAK